MMLRLMVLSILPVVTFAMEEEIKKLPKEQIRQLIQESRMKHLYRQGPRVYSSQSNKKLLDQSINKLAEAIDKGNIRGMIQKCYDVASATQGFVPKYLPEAGLGLVTDQPDEQNAGEFESCSRDFIQCIEDADDIFGKDSGDQEQWAN